MKEKDFVTIINNSIKATGGCAYKIPDIPGYHKENKCPVCQSVVNNFRFTGKKPFDNIAVLYPYAWYIEVKYSRGICGFSEKILKPHQKENLLKIRDNADDHGTVMPVVIYGCYIPRKVKRIYIFHINYVVENKVSKKQLINDLPYIHIQKTEYRKKVKGQMKWVKEDLFNANEMMKAIIM